MVSMGNTVNTSDTQRKLSLDMGSRLVPEHRTEGNLRKLLFLARPRPHTQGHPGAKKERGANRGRSPAPQRAHGEFTKQPLSRQLGPPCTSFIL